MARVILLHTCDFHGRLSLQRASAIAQVRQDRPGCLLLDCGDALHAGNLNPIIGAEPIRDRMNRAGYHAMAMGNRETHLWRWAVRRKLNGFSFPILSSNLIHPQPLVQPWSILTASDGVNVGVLALTPQMVRPGTVSAHFSSVQFAEPITAAAEVAAYLKGKVDLLVCLSHYGRAFDQRLAEAVPQLDVILGGHDHSPGLPEGMRVGTTILARSSPFGKDIGEVVIEMNGGTVVSSVARLMALPE